MVTFEVRPEGPIVFTALIDGFGPVAITSRRPGIFNGRLQNPTVLREALTAVEEFADAHRDELAEHYGALAKPNAA